MKKLSTPEKQDSERPVGYTVYLTRRYWFRKIGLMRLNQLETTLTKGPSGYDKDMSTWAVLTGEDPSYWPAKGMSALLSINDERAGCD
ncbi:hypothetical protein ACLOJK_008046 [Asimina triloba]